MGGFSSERSVDSLILSIAARFHGIATRRRLLAAGISARQIDVRVADGRLRALHHGVYLVGAVPPEHAYPQAALFACGEPSALGCRSALSIWRLRSYPAKAYPWVTVPPKRRIERQRIIVTRAPLEARDVRTKYGMRVVSPPRAILDYAAIAGDEYDLESLVAEAHIRRLAREPELRDQVEQNKGRPGTRLLRKVLDIEGGPQRTRSGGERWFLRLLRENGIRGFQANEEIFGREVDFLWRDLNFCIELDGWDGHSSRAAFERDRQKWAFLGSRGLTVMPLAARTAQLDEEGTVALVREMLRQAAGRRAA